MLIPSYNAGAHVKPVVEGTARFIPKERIIIVDDGSSDNTFEVARATGAVVLKHDTNRGKGAALATGIDHAHRMGLAYVITLDADGQHNPGEIPKFIDALERTGADIIIGNRMSNPGVMPLIRRFTNRTTSFLVSLRAGTKIPDSQSGYRLHNVELCNRIRLVTTRYETESEILIKAARLGGVITAIPIESIYEGAESSIHPVIDTYRFFRLFIKSFFW